MMLKNNFYSAFSQCWRWIWITIIKKAKITALSTSTYTKTHTQKQKRIKQQIQRLYFIQNNGRMLFSKLFSRFSIHIIKHEKFVWMIAMKYRRERENKISVQQFEIFACWNELLIWNIPLFLMHLYEVFFRFFLLFLSWKTNSFMPCIAPIRE